MTALSNHVNLRKAITWHCLQAEVNKQGLHTEREEKCQNKQISEKIERHGPQTESYAYISQIVNIRVERLMT